LAFSIAADTIPVGIRQPELALRFFGLMFGFVSIEGKTVEFLGVEEEFFLSEL